MIFFQKSDRLQSAKSPYGDPGVKGYETSSLASARASNPTHQQKHRRNKQLINQQLMGK